MLKKIAIGFAGLLVVILLAGKFLYSNLDSYVKQAIETYGSAATKAEVHVSRVNLSLTTGEGSLGKLRVGSPEGYKAEKTIDLGAVSVTIDPYSVAGTGPVVIKDITVEKPDVTYEVLGDSDNLKTLARNAQKYAESWQSAPKVEPPASLQKEGGKAKEKAPERKLIIDRLSIRDGNVTVIHPLLRGRKISTRLPPIELKNIGRAEGGATPAEVAQQVINAIKRTATDSALNDLSRELGSLKLDDLKNAGHDAIKGVGKAGSNAGEKIRGLFGD
jgi:hypothetical protein